MLAIELIHLPHKAAGIFACGKNNRKSDNFKSGRDI
jgi:hypothetical protein